MQLNRTLLATPTVEVPDYQAAVDEIRAAPAMPAVPAAVLTADKPLEPAPRQCRFDLAGLDGGTGPSRQPSQRHAHHPHATAATPSTSNNPEP